jgi:hypothetical protein
MFLQTKGERSEGIGETQISFGKVKTSSKILKIKLTSNI